MSNLKEINILVDMEATNINKSFKINTTLGKYFVSNAVTSFSNFLRRTRPMYVEPLSVEYRYFVTQLLLKIDDKFKEESLMILLRVDKLTDINKAVQSAIKDIENDTPKHLQDYIVGLKPTSCSRTKPKSERLLSKLYENNSNQEFITYVDKACDFVQKQTLDKRQEFENFVDSMFDIVSNGKILKQNREELRNYIDSHLQKYGGEALILPVENLHVLEDVKPSRMMVDKNSHQKE